MKAIENYFLQPKTVVQKQYEALRMFFVEKIPGQNVAKHFGYTYRGFTTIVSNFRKEIQKVDNSDDLFFMIKKKGRKRKEQVSDSKDLVVSLRKKYYSIEDIKTTLDSKGYDISEKTIYNILKEDGFTRLPRRTKLLKENIEPPGIKAETSMSIDFSNEKFKSSGAGILCLMPYLKKYGVIDIIEKSDYPQTKEINKLSSILSFVALKASNIRRYSTDNLWCMDRGIGLFAGLNVLPKNAWFSSYSHRVTSNMNLSFIKLLHQKWKELGLLSNTSNLDFTTIPYWGENGHLENNWSGKRNKGLASMLAVLAHDPDTGIIDYGDVNIMHKDQNAVVLEYLDFYSDQEKLDYLIFDSKFTNYQNLDKLNKRGIKFITIRRRGKKILQNIDQLSDSDWRKIRVEIAGNKKRTIKVAEENVSLKDYDQKVRQIIITGHGKIKPAVVITNDFDLPTEKIIRKYTKRWNVEKAISEQIDFFHLNNVSSSMVIKVDFDLTMSILTHNIYRLFALDLKRYSNLSDRSIYEKFICNSADISIEKNEIKVGLKKKRNLPLVLENLKQTEEQKYALFKNKKLKIYGATYS